MSVTRQQLEAIVSDPSLQVPFGVVELSLANGQIEDLRLEQIPGTEQVHVGIRDEVRRTLAAMKLNEWGRLVFFYLSHVPVECPANMPDHAAWEVFLADVNRQLHPRAIANVMFFDGLPDPNDHRPRLISLAAHDAIHEVMTTDGRETRPLPAFSIKLPNVKQESNSSRSASIDSGRTIKLLFVIHPRPDEAWGIMTRIAAELHFVPEFLHELQPAAQEMVPGLTYLQVDQNDGRASCSSRAIAPDRNDIINGSVVHIETSPPWVAMVYGDNLGAAILEAHQLSESLPPPGPERKWPVASGLAQSHPFNWLTRDLQDEIPRFSEEPDGASYPPGEGKLHLDRWLFWNWQCGRWTWTEICKQSGAIGQLARAKRNTAQSPDQTKTAKARAQQYGKWLRIALRTGR